MWKLLIAGVSCSALGTAGDGNGNRLGDMPPCGARAS